MTEQYRPEDRSKASVAGDEARDLGQQGKEATQHVADVAGSQAREVVHEAGSQARNLADELGSDLKQQAAHQQQRAASGLRSISDELHSMASKSEGNGTATHLVTQAAQRASSAAGWLEDRDPGSLLEEVKRFARRRPGAFLAIAAGAGLVAGRLTRGVMGAQQHHTPPMGQDATGRHEFGRPQEPEYPPRVPGPMPGAGVGEVGGVGGVGGGTVAGGTGVTIDETGSTGTTGMGASGTQGGYEGLDGAGNTQSFTGSDRPGPGYSGSAYTEASGSGGGFASTEYGGSETGAAGGIRPVEEPPLIRGEGDDDSGLLSAPGSTSQVPSAPQPPPAVDREPSDAPLLDDPLLNDPLRRKDTDR